MSTPEVSAAYGEWPLEPGPFVVRYPIELLHEIEFNVKDAARRISHGGMETGGFLFGRTAPVDGREVVQIEAFRPIDCEHAFGPSFVLSERDLAKMREQLLQAGSDSQLEGLRLLGWFVGHARNPMRLTDHEASLFDRLFPRPGQMTLLVKPEKFAPSNIAFLVRAQDRKVDRDGAPIAFPLPPLSAPAPAPVVQVEDDTPEVANVPADTSTDLIAALELGAPIDQVREEIRPAQAPVPDPPVTVVPETKPAPVPEIHQTPPQKSVTAPAPLDAFETELIAIETVATHKAAPKTEAKVESVAPEEEKFLIEEPAPPVRSEPPPQPRPLTSDAFLSLENLRARRLERLERTEHFEASEEMSRRPAAYEIMQEQPSRRIWKPLAAVLLVLVLCTIAFRLYQQYFTSAIPLQIADGVDKLTVSWPPDETRDSNDAAIRVDGGAPIPLSEEQRVLGRSDVPSKGGEVQVELVVHHWFGDTHGRIVFMKPALTALP
ncbi:MAG: hypothetical protein WA324_12195 [Bryobacteraceae bacterium]